MLIAGHSEGLDEPSHATLGRAAGDRSLSRNRLQPPRHVAWILASNTRLPLDMGGWLRLMTNSDLIRQPSHAITYHYLPSPAPIARHA